MNSTPAGQQGQLKKNPIEFDAKIRLFLFELGTTSHFKCLNTTCYTYNDAFYMISSHPVHCTTLLSRINADEWALDCFGSILISPPGDD